MAKLKFPHYWICKKCAEKRGGLCGEGMYGNTVVLQKCKYCKGKNHAKDEFIAPWVDYDWPKDAQKDSAAKAIRG